MPNIQNVKIGAAEVTFKGVQLGHTAGPVAIKITRTHVDVRVNEFAGAIDKGLTDEMVEITVPLAETSYNLLKEVFMHSTSLGTATKLPFGSRAGETLRSVSGNLMIHKIVNAAGDRSEDFYLFKAVSTGDVTWDYDNAKQRVATVTFQALVDSSQADGSYMGVLGDYES